MPGVEEPAAHYEMTMGSFRTRLHRDLPPTYVWGFNGSMPGPTIHAQRGQTVRVRWINDLPKRHFLPIDHSIHGAGSSLPDVRNVTHLHGGRVPAASDGYPDDWYGPGRAALYTYPNNQRAATLWYHDHAIGITRLNNLAGLAGFYIIHDDFERSLNLPSGAYDLELMISDRTFDENGQLSYPVSGRPGTPHIPEFFGETMLVNGRATPYLIVEPRKYRFRILNQCNARFLGLTLSSGQPFIQIGTDQGLAPEPVALDRLLLVPSERSDVIVDFSKLAGRQVVMKNDAPAPYPRGGAVVPPNLMQFRVGTSASGKDASVIPSKLLPYAPIDPSTAVKVRDLALVEVRDAMGAPIIDLLENAHWSAPITENPVIDTVEIWNLVNATDDAHPIHIHMINFQVIDRRRYHDDVFLHEGKLTYLSAPEPPAAQEVGWKDVVLAEPDKVTRVIAKFEGYTGRYVWHCHILEHEDNEMMRPYEVLPASAALSGGPTHVMSAIALRGSTRR
ncbi:MAG TPA: multicopper oxidase [Candidatus Binataceae bacterium]|nr:multicopper oxidase [Candidatus Binataceae bacterium]